MTELLILFPTTTQAMKMENQNLSGRLVPVPSSVKAGCGFAWKTELCQEEGITKWMKEQGVLWEKILKYDWGE
ncbi:MAG: DUF3343 domain-containing protein [Eubacteriales bacterium]